jgi:putative transposase
MRKLIQTEHQRRLPHFHHPGATFFVTTHLEGSIPFDVLRKLKEKREEKIQAILRKNEAEKEKLIYLAHREHFLLYDELLDKCENSPTYLQDPVVGQIVKDALFDYDGKLYNLIAFTLSQTICMHFWIFPFKCLKANKWTWIFIPILTKP